MGTTFDGNAGAINFSVFDSAGNGRTGITITSDAGGVVGYFKADHSRLDPTLTATSSDGGGYIFQLTPGKVNLTMRGSGAACTPTGHEG